MNVTEGMTKGTRCQECGSKMYDLNGDRLPPGTPKTCKDCEMVTVRFR